MRLRCGTKKNLIMCPSYENFILQPEPCIQYCEKTYRMLPGNIFSLIRHTLNYFVEKPINVAWKYIFAYWAYLKLL